MTLADKNQPDTAKRFEKIKKLTDKALVTLLWEGNSEAWEYICSYTVIPVLHRATKKIGTSYYRIMQDRQLNETSILAALYEDMICQRKLDNFQYKCPVIYWMRWYVVKNILTYCGKNPPPLSEDDVPEVYTDKTETKELIEVIQQSFAELWRSNPMRAYVYLLKQRESSSSEEIKQMLAISSKNNVDQYYSRASADMRKLIKKYSGEGI